MLPTIDISLIGVILAIWNVAKVIWDYTSKAFTWIMQQALALAIGSKFWATGFFLVGSLALISMFSVLIDYILQAIVGLVVPSLPLGLLTDGVDFLGLFLNLSDVTSFVSFVISCASFYLLAQNYTMWYIRIYGTFMALRSSFKV